MSAGRRRVGRLTTGALLSAALAACNGTTSYLDATGSAGRAEGTLGWWLTVVASVVVLFVCVAVLAGVARHRGERNAPTRDAAGTAAEPGDEGAGAHRREVRSGLG